MGIEPTYSAWKADVLPLNYTRIIEFPYVESASLLNSNCSPLRGHPHYLNGVPRETRTPNLLIRSQTLYPIELWAHYI
jgi:hypothetical protein